MNNVIGKGSFATICDGRLDVGIHIAIIGHVNLVGLAGSQLVNSTTTAHFGDPNVGDEGIDVGEVVIQRQDGIFFNF